MERLEARGRAAGEAAAARVVERVAARAREAASGKTIEVEAGRVAISGRGVRAAFRWIGGLLR